MTTSEANAVFVRKKRNVFVRKKQKFSKIDAKNNLSLKNLYHSFSECHSLPPVAPSKKAKVAGSLFTSSFSPKYLKLAAP